MSILRRKEAIMFKEYKGYKYICTCKGTFGRKESYWVEFKGEMPPRSIIEEILYKNGCFMPSIVLHPEENAAGATGWID